MLVPLSSNVQENTHIFVMLLPPLKTRVSFLKTTVVVFEHV